jgi:2',3'-cyclic-nucleotide 3'-phosphodiesterase
MTINTNSNTLVLLQGLPGAGKSTWIKENNLEEYTLSKDDIRVMAGCVINGTISQNMNGTIKEIIDTLLECRLKHQVFTVMDETNVSYFNVAHYKELARQYGFKVVVVRFDISFEESLERQNGRGYKAVPEKELIKLHKLLNNNRCRYIDYKDIVIERG